MQLEKTATQNKNNNISPGHHQPAHNQNHSSHADQENKKKKKQKDKKDEKNQKLINQHQLNQDQDESNEDQNEESTEDLNTAYEPKKQKKIKLHDNEKNQTSISSKEKEEQTLKEKENDKISEDNNENEDDDEDDFPVNGQSTLSLKKVYTRQMNHKNEQVKSQDEDDKIVEEDEESNEEQEEDEEEEEEEEDDEEEDEEDKEQDDDEEESEEDDKNLNKIKNKQSKQVKTSMGSKSSKDKHKNDASSDEEEDEEEEQNNEDDDEEQGEDEEDYLNEDEEEDDDEDYEVSDEDLLQQRNDRLLNTSWADETLKKLEIDELDEPIDEDQDIEGFDIEQVMKDEKRKQYIESLMECLPPYMYCTSQEEKDDFFEKLNKEFKRNLQIDSYPLKHSHKKRVKFNFQKAQVVEFDLTKKVKNISKLPVQEGITEIKIN